VKSRFGKTLRYYLQNKTFDMKKQGPNSCSFVSFIRGTKSRDKAAFRTQKL